jgi:hypothetical protein
MLLKKFPITDNGKQYLVEIYTSETYADTWCVKINTIVEKNIGVLKYKGKNEEWNEIFSLKTEHCLMRDFFTTIKKVDFIEMVKTSFYNYNEHLKTIEVENLEKKLKEIIINDSMLELEKWNGKI